MSTKGSLTQKKINTTLEILKKARALITDPTRWTQGEDAKGKTGKSVLAYGRAATCWCAYGAVYKYDSTRSLIPDRYLTEAAKKMGYNNAATLNDYTDHPTVLNMFDNAIALAEKALAV